MGIPVLLGDRHALMLTQAGTGIIMLFIMVVLKHLSHMSKDGCIIPFLVLLVLINSPC